MSERTQIERRIRKGPRSQRGKRESKLAEERVTRWNKCCGGNENENEVIKCWVATLAGNQGGFCRGNGKQRSCREVVGPAEICRRALQVEMKPRAKTRDGKSLVEC